MPQIYKVGGCVRDRLLGLDSKDIDFTFVLDDLNQSVGEGFDEMTEYLQSEGYEIFLSTFLWKIGFLSPQEMQV
jgi:tRNA nucleotidyltransferase/poly(A) polymerase